VFRADAAFAKPEIYEALEARGVKYAIRIPANDGLERRFGMFRDDIPEEGWLHGHGVSHY